MADEKWLIDANAPLEQLSDYMEKLHCSDDYRDGLYRGMEIAESYIKNAPTIDAVEVVHGRWVEMLDDVLCSKCGHSWNIFDNCAETFNYCPNCGAKMDGGNEDAKCTECVHYGVCKELVGEQKIRIADNACSFAEKCVAYKHKENFVEVVRCKDCKHRYTAASGVIFCTQHLTMSAKDDDFCSYGERREGE